MYMYINKLGSRSYRYIHLKSSHICVIHLVLERCCFEAVLPKKRLRPLGVNFGFEEDPARLSESPLDISCVNVEGSDW